MWEIAFWLYFANAVFLIVHEIDSAYWEEWNLFKMGGGIGLFLVLHVPMIGALLFGLVELSRRSLTGSVISLVVAAAGLFAFIIHIFFMARGREEFRTPVSIAVLAAILLVSAFQGVITVMLIFGEV